MSVDNQRRLIDRRLEVGHMIVEYRIDDVMTFSIGTIRSHAFSLERGFDLNPNDGDGRA